MLLEAIKVACATQVFCYQVLNTYCENFSVDKFSSNLIQATISLLLLYYNSIKIVFHHYFFMSVRSKNFTVNYYEHETYKIDDNKFNR